MNRWPYTSVRYSGLPPLECPHRYFCPITSGQQMLDVFALQPADEYNFMGYLIVYLVGFRILAFWALRFRQHIVR